MVKRVLLIHAAGGLGGGTASLVDVMHMLTPRFEVAAAVPTDPSDAAALVAANGFQVLRVSLPYPELHAYNGAPNFSSRQFWRGVARRPRVYRAWTKLIRDHAADIVIVNSSVLAPLGPAIRKAGAKSVCLVRETLPARGTRARLLNTEMSRWFDGLIYISQFDMDRATATGGQSSTIVRDCVRPSAFRRIDREQACRELGLDSEAYNVLYTGGHSWLKGLDVALEAVSRAQIERVRLVVAGAGIGSESTAKSWLKRSLRRRSIVFDDRVKELSEDAYVRAHIDNIGPQRDMSACYSAADLVVFPAVLAHQSRPLLEAAYYGLPALCSDFPQFQEHAVALHTFAPGDPEAMARELVRLAHDRELGRVSGLANGEYCEATHDFSKEGRHLSEFVRDLVSDQK